MIGVMHVVSVSAGKDSTATLCYALQTQPREAIRAVFADTGNEHDMVYEYLDYLDDALGIKIVRLRRDFTPEWIHRREWLRSDAPRKDRKDRKAYTEEQIAKVQAVFDGEPTGNPYNRSRSIAQRRKRNERAHEDRRVPLPGMRRAPVARRQRAVVPDGELQAHAATVSDA